MFVLAPGVGMKQQCHSAVRFLVVLVARVLGFDVEPEQLGQATRREPGKERYGCNTAHPWTHRASILRNHGRAVKAARDTAVGSSARRRQVPALGTYTFVRRR